MNYSGAPQFESQMNYHLMYMGWVGLFLNWLHTDAYADHATLIPVLQDKPGKHHVGTKSSATRD